MIGITSRCKDCARIKDRKRRSDPKLKKRQAKRQKEYLRENKDVKKQCAKCKRSKRLDLFFTSKRNVDGRQSRCKACATKDAKARMLIPKNKKRDRKTQKIYHSKPEVKKRKTAYDRHPDNKKRFGKKKRVRLKKCKKEDPLLYRASTWRYKMLETPGSDTKWFTREQFVQMQKDMPYCQTCDDKINYTEFRGNPKSDSPSLDKLIPKLGYTKNNVNIICVKCNFRKGDALHLDLLRIIKWMKRVIKSGIHDRHIDEFEGDMNDYEKIFSKARSARRRVVKNGDVKYLTVRRLFNMILKTKKCPVCKIPFYHVDDSKYNLHLMSFDKFIPSKGYVRGNVLTICTRCNTHKKDFSLKDIIKMCKWIKKNGTCVN